MCNNNVDISQVTHLANYGKKNHHHHHHQNLCEFPSAYDGKSTSALPKSFVEEPKVNSFDSWTKCSTYISAVCFLFNFGTGIATVHALFVEGNREWFLLSLAFLVVSRMVTNVFSMVWHVHDQRVYLKRRSWTERKSIASNKVWTLRVLCHVTLLGPWLRYFDLINYGAEMNHKGQTHEILRSYKHANAYSTFVHEDRDVRMLELLQSFLGDSPQLAFQMYILATRSPQDYDKITSIKQLAVIVTSLYCTSWALCNYQRALRFSMPHKRNLSRCGSLMQLLWRFGTVTARLLSFSLFASAFKSWVFLVIVVHWWLMFAWISLQKTEFCANEYGDEHPWQERLFNLVMSAIGITCFVNVKDEPTRFKYSCYYAAVLLENGLMVGMWYSRADPKLWYHLPSLVGVSASFVAGLLFMLTYYGFFHPNGRLLRKLPVTC